MRSQGGPPTQPRGKEGFPEERCGTGWEGGEDAGQLEPWREHCWQRTRGAQKQAVGECVGLGSSEHSLWPEQATLNAGER